MTSSVGGMGEKVDFSDLLQEAEQMVADLEPEAAGAIADLPRVERNMTQLMEACDQLYNKTSRDVKTQEVNAAILLGSVGVDLPAMQQHLRDLTAKLKSGAAAAPISAASLDYQEPLRDTDIAGFLKRERENALLSVIEETKRLTFEQVDRAHWEATHSEWESTKRGIMQALDAATGDTTGGDISRSLRPELSRPHESTLHRTVEGVIGSSLDAAQVAYAAEVAAYNSSVASALSTGAPRPDLMSKFSSLFPEDRGDREVSAIWQMVSAMSSIGKEKPKSSTPGDWRSSSAGCRAVASAAREYLERSYKRYIQSTVHSNLREAQLGGVPGTFHLVRSYLRIRMDGASSTGLEDGSYEGAPVWAAVYHCLRCGDRAAAASVAANAGPGLAEALKLLNEAAASPDGRLSQHSEHMVRLAYRRSVRATTDPYKRAVYCIFGACDPQDEHAEVATSLDDYLWIKLSQVRTAEESGHHGGLDSSTASTAAVHVDTLSLPQFQHMILEEYGETHFKAFEEPVLYFQVLILTGQFESAIEFLFRVDRFRSHSAHVAIALNENDLLAVATNSQAGLLTRDPSDRYSSCRRLNLARLLLVYVRAFQASDPIEAINYFYFLRDVRGPRGDNLYMACVAELVLESREFDLLLGSIGHDGTRQPGLVDKLQNSFSDTQQVIESVAQESESRGMLEDSVMLYDLAQKHEKVVDLLNKLLAQVVTMTAVAESRRDRLQRLAVDIAKRYRSQGHTASQESTASLFLLLDLMTFFDKYHAKKHDDAIDIIQRIRLIPLTQQEVDPMVSNFRALREGVRANMPDLLIAVMTILYEQYNQAKAGSAGTPQGHQQLKSSGRERQLENLREKAKAIITFAGMIPYRMPGDTNARLVKMEVLMN